MLTKFYESKPAVITIHHWNFSWGSLLIMTSQLYNLDPHIIIPPPNMSFTNFKPDLVIEMKM